MGFDLTKPGLYIVKSIFACNVIAEEDDVRTSIEDASNRTERLLASRVPDL